MDDADAMAVYEAFQTACDAYYETLTEGQQAQLKKHGEAGGTVRLVQPVCGTGGGRTPAPHLRRKLYG